MSSSRRTKQSKSKAAGSKSSRRGTAPRRGTNKAEEKSKETELKTNIELPQTCDFETSVPAMKVFPTMYDTDVNDMKAAFDELLQLLKERKESCLIYAQERVDKFKFDRVETEPIKIDVSTVESSINHCGTTLGEQEYELERSKINVTDKLSELNACEEKLSYIKGDFTKTKSVKGIKNAIEKVKAALKETEPVLEEAKNAVKTITKSSLDEIRTLPKPNKLLVKAVKACALLIGTPEKELGEWKDIRKLLKTSFITSLISFEGANVTSKIVDTIEKDYLGRNNDDMKEDDKLTYENVNKANAVAGSLVKWLEAQLKYNEMLPQVTAKKKELKDLETQLGMMDGSSSDLSNAIIILEKQIPQCKDKLRKLVKVEGKLEETFNQAVADYGSNNNPQAAQ